MSTLFVQSSLRNTKSFASKYSCLWRRGGAILCIRNQLLRNEGLPCRLFLEARGLDSLTLWRQFTCAATGTSQPVSISPPLPSICRLLWILFKENPMWVGPHCHLDPLFTGDHLPSPSAPSPLLVEKWLSLWKLSLWTEPVEMSYLKPIEPSQPGDSQTLPFHTLS